MCIIDRRWARKNDELEILGEGARAVAAPCPHISVGRSRGELATFAEKKGKSGLGKKSEKNRGMFRLEARQKMEIGPLKKPGKPGYRGVESHPSEETRDETRGEAQIARGARGKGRGAGGYWIEGGV